MLNRWVVALGAMALAAGLGFWTSTSLRARPTSEEKGAAAQIAFPEIAQPVQIDRDRHGVPHIDAAREADAFFALGYCQSQDRLAQLLHLRRRAHGTAAEEVGSAAMEADQIARLLDFPGLADRQWNNLTPAARLALEAFAAGVNAHIAQTTRRADDTSPRGATPPWIPQDSLALYKLFAWGLSESIEASLVLNDLVSELGATDAVRFFPAPNASRPGAARATAAASPWVSRGARALRASLGLAAHGVGSSAFAVGGRLTGSGFPVLVADSHFEPIAPAALYLAHLRTPEADIAGATLAGVPVFWWGRNSKLAWAAVNAGVVVTDLYTETLRKQRSEYHDGRRWRPLEARDEEIAVRGGGDATLAVRRTAHGPLLPARDPESDEAIAVAWTGARADSGRGIAALLEVAHARDGEEVRAALRAHDDPPIAMVWAEAAGGAGLQVAGWIPHRRLAAQLLPLPGRAATYDWDEPVPFASLPAQRIEAGEGVVVAADQRFGARAGEDSIDSLWRTGARAARLRALLADPGLRDAQRTDLRAFASLLADDRLDRSVALVETALALAGEPLATQEASELTRLLREWDGRAALDSIGCSAYHVFLDVLAKELFEARLGDDRLAHYLALPALDLEALVLGVLDDAAAGGSDVWSEPGAVRDAVRKSLREAWLALSFEHGPDPRRWIWGALHELRFRGISRAHPGLGPFPYGGSPHAVLAAGYSSADPFAVSLAATARFAVDTATLDIALTALAPGQSEGARAGRRDGLDGWLEGRFALLATRRLEVEDLSVEKQVLEPVR